MKKTLTIILILFCSAKTNSQNRKLDSLDNLISKEKSDTTRIQLTLSKIYILSSLNLDSTISLALKTLEEAKAIHYYRGELELRGRLASNYAFKGNYKEASEQLNYLEKFIKPSKDSSAFAEVFSNWGMVYGMQSKYDSSIYFFGRAITIDEREGIKADLSGNYSNIAIGYQQQSNYPMALFYQQKALKLAEEQKSENSQAYAYMNMGNTYDNMGDTTRAENAYLKAIELAKKNNLKNVELYGYTNLASMYIKQGKWQKSYEFGMKAAELGGEMGDQGIEAASMSKAAVALVNLHEPTKATELSKRAIAIADSSAQPLNIYQAYSSMGTVLRMQGEYKKAIPFFEKSIESLKDADLYTVDNGKLFQEISECYEKTGNYPKALEMHKQAALISDSVRNRDNVQKATELTMNYEFDKKEQATKALQATKDEITRSRQLALIIGLGLALILIIVAFVGYRNKQRANALLLIQKKEIEVTLLKLKNTQAQLIQSEKMASLGELTAGIAHEIQNPLNFVNNFSEVNKELLLELKNGISSGNMEEVQALANDLIENEEKILRHGKKADAIVKGMLQHSRSGIGVKEPTDINALANEYIRFCYNGIRAKDKLFNATVKTEFDPTIGKINVIPQDIGRVILNLLTNAFYAVASRKKTDANNYEPTIIVSTQRIADHVNISVRDNGNGIPQKSLDKIFQPFFTTKPAGEGTGLGLSLSYDIIKAHGGKIDVETKETEASPNDPVGPGTEFIIQIPVQN